MESIHSDRPPLFGFKYPRDVQFPHNVSCLRQELEHLAMIPARFRPDLRQFHWFPDSRHFDIPFVVCEEMMDQ